MMETIRKCQLLELKIAKEIVRVCDENKIDYVIIAGTLLGAIRHNGFIPWDDDMDIGMTRENYNRFIKIAKSTLGEEFYLQTWDIEGAFGLPIAKVRLLGTEFVEKNAQHVPINNGIYVDIFPFDNVPNNPVKRGIQRIVCQYYKHLLLNKCGYEYVDVTNIIKHFVASLLRLISKLYTLEYIHYMFLKQMTKYNSYKTNQVVTFGGASCYKKEKLEHDWVTSRICLPFEDTFFSAPKDWEQYLTHFYGDYMIPPSEEERYKGHGITRISFGKYESLFANYVPSR